MFRVGCRTCDPAAPHSTVHLPSCNSLFRPFATSGSGFLSEQTKQWKVDTVLSCLDGRHFCFLPLPICRCLELVPCPSALHHLARRPGKARSGLDLFLYLSRKPSFCPILPWFCAYSSRYPVNFRTGRCCTSLLTCGTKNSIVSFECRCRL